MSYSLAQKLTAQPCSQVEIYISCRNLLNMDIMSKSDPLAVFYININGSWIEHGRTERIDNNLNPNFSKTILLDYFFEEVQKVKISLYDIDNDTPSLEDDDFLGDIELTLGEIVSNSPIIRSLTHSPIKHADPGKIILRAEEVSKQKDLLHLHFSATNVDKKDFFGKSDPFLEFSRLMGNGTYQLIHRTEVIKKTLNPVWKPFEIKSSKLCSGNIEELFKVDCFDWNSNGSSDFIGSFETSVAQLTQQGLSKNFELINPKMKAKKSSYKNSGVVNLISCQVTTEYSFLDFIFGGLELKFCVAIDFTASNGDPRSPESLHHINPYAPNHYMRAIRSVGDVIKDYDRSVSDQMFPCFGFGARIPPQMEVSHCFPLNFFNPSNAFCRGVNEMLEMYYQCVTRVQFYGPTNFTPIIEHTARFAESSKHQKDPLKYFVLLIITDGVISDMAQTVRTIVRTSALPLSIIIVGVGMADFASMDALDSDEQLLKDDRGNVALRDIVQFVPFRQFEGGTQAALAKHVLAELPGQVAGYYKINKIKPGIPKNVNPDNFMSNEQYSPTNQKIPSGASNFDPRKIDSPGYAPPPYSPPQYPIGGFQPPLSGGYPAPIEGYQAFAEACQPTQSRYNPYASGYIEKTTNP